MADDDRLLELVVRFEELREAGQTVDIAELCDWIAHLEIMFISQADDTPEGLAWVRRMVEHFVVPAITPRSARPGRG